MDTNVVGRHMDITDAIRKHAEQKVSKLDKYADLIISNEFTVGKIAEGKELFWAELLVSVRSHPEIVAKAQGHDVYVLIDEAIAKAGRQLHDFKEKIKLEKR
ncbi:MAG: ribosome-associated translation inhibitor RaiA [Phycisphaerales bacterium]|nr:ribosome-associated translation inhibitor RaiA [Planctomycetota bacterium]MCH8509585.1 ribosome-associated translation inhibitor RaiA [Phycisphaerales bacterium]